VPAIIFSRIYALGATCDVFAMSEPPRCAEKFYDLRDRSSETLFLLPSMSADASVISYKNTSPSPTAALVGAVFLIFVRGLPLEETEIECGGEIFKISRIDNSEKLSIFLPKCKQKCANKSILVDKMEFGVSEAEYLSRKILTLKCDDASCFEDSSLARIMLEDADFAPDGALAYSCSSKIIDVRAKFINQSPDNLICAAVLASRAAGLGALMDKAVVKIAGYELAVEIIGGSCCVTLDVPQSLTLAAPDIF
jgi:hypothetical protein